MEELGKSLEIIFVSSDQDQGAFDGYYGEHPWVAVPFENERVRNGLGQKFGVRGIPALIILNGSGA